MFSIEPSMSYDEFVHRFMSDVVLKESKFRSTPQSWLGGFFWSEVPDRSTLLSCFDPEGFLDYNPADDPVEFESLISDVGSEPISLPLLQFKEMTGSKRVDRVSTDERRLTMASFLKHSSNSRNNMNGGVSGSATFVSSESDILNNSSFSSDFSSDEEMVGEVAHDGRRSFVRKRRGNELQKENNLFDNNSSHTNFDKTIHTSANKYFSSFHKEHHNKHNNSKNVTSSVRPDTVHVEKRTSIDSINTNMDRKLTKNSNITYSLPLWRVSIFQCPPSITKRCQECCFCSKEVLTSMTQERHDISTAGSDSFVHPLMMSADDRSSSSSESSSSSSSFYSSKMVCSTSGEVRRLDQQEQHGEQHRELNSDRIDELTLGDGSFSPPPPLCTPFTGLHHHSPPSYNQPNNNNNNSNNILQSGIRSGRMHHHHHQLLHGGISCPSPNSLNGNVTQRQNSNNLMNINSVVNHNHNNNVDNVHSYDVISPPPLHTTDETAVPQTSNTTPSCFFRGHCACCSRSQTVVFIKTHQAIADPTRIHSFLVQSLFSPPFPPANPSGTTAANPATSALGHDWLNYIGQTVPSLLRASSFLLAAVLGPIFVFSPWRVPLAGCWQSPNTSPPRVSGSAVYLLPIRLSPEWIENVKKTRKSGLLSGGQKHSSSLMNILVGGGKNGGGPVGEAVLVALGNAFGSYVEEYSKLRAASINVSSLGSDSIVNIANNGERQDYTAEVERENEDNTLNTSAKLCSCYEPQWMEPNVKKGFTRGTSTVASSSSNIFLNNNNMNYMNNKILGTNHNHHHHHHHHYYKGGGYSPSSFNPVQLTAPLSSVSSVSSTSSSSSSSFIDRKDLSFLSSDLLTKLVNLFSWLDLDISNRQSSHGHPSSQQVQQQDSNNHCASKKKINYSKENAIFCFNCGGMSSESHHRLNKITHYHNIDSNPIAAAANQTSNTSCSTIDSSPPLIACLFSSLSPSSPTLSNLALPHHLSLPSNHHASLSMSLRQVHLTLLSSIPSLTLPPLSKLLSILSSIAPLAVPARLLGHVLSRAHLGVHTVLSHPLPFSFRPLQQPEYRGQPATSSSDATTENCHQVVSSAIWCAPRNRMGVTVTLLDRGVLEGVDICVAADRSSLPDAEAFVCLLEKEILRTEEAMTFGVETIESSL